MSEPLSSAEIEDVLSSIRRLVSEDLRPVARTPVAAVPPAPVEFQRPALILTPALRVVSRLVPDPVPESSIEDVVAAVGAAVGDDAEDWESEIGDPAPDLESPWDNTDWDTPEPSEPADAVAVVVQNIEVLPDASEEMISEMIIQADPEEVSADPDRPGWAQTGVDDHFSFHSQVTPEVPVSDANDDWIDQAEAAVIAELGRPEIGPDAVDMTGDGPEMTFDEQVLRNLVRDLIREELQGDLGERITRNIRKLVRAEIARALAAADLG